MGSREREKKHMMSRLLTQTYRFYSNFINPTGQLDLHSQHTHTEFSAKDVIMLVNNSLFYKTRRLLFKSKQYRFTSLNMWFLMSALKTLVMLVKPLSQTFRTHPVCSS